LAGARSTALAASIPRAAAMSQAPLEELLDVPTVAVFGIDAPAVSPPTPPVPDEELVSVEELEVDEELVSVEELEVDEELELDDELELDELEELVSEPSPTATASVSVASCEPAVHVAAAAWQA
jgi:hypothetical protein